MPMLTTLDPEVTDLLSDVLQARQAVLLDHRTSRNNTQVSLFQISVEEAVQWLRQVADDLERRHDHD